MLLWATPGCSRLLPSLGFFRILYRVEREEFFAQFKSSPRQYYVTCSGTVAPFPSNQDDWEKARANGEFMVDGAEIISDDTVKSVYLGASFNL